MNNHRNRLKKLTNLYHFSSDGHSEDDISIMPIEEVITNDRVSSNSTRLEREDYWCRELCTFYPYGLNDNVRRVGNISKCKEELVVNKLFNKQQRKFRKRTKANLKDLTMRVENLLDNYLLLLVLMLEF